MPEKKPSLPAVSIWVDADACPKQIKDFLFRVSNRRNIRLVLVANHTSGAPDTERISVITVPHGADKADDRIIQHLKAGDIVVTQDIPLASRAVEKQCVAIGVRGELFDEHSIGQRLATRNLMDHLRSAGVETKGPKPFDSKNFQLFANQLDRILTKSLDKKG